jgi:hypothetical protein
MHLFERRLHARDFDQRVAHPFDWGLEFLGMQERIITASGSERVIPSSGYQVATAPCTVPPIDPREFIRRFNADAMADSLAFFTPPPSRADDFVLTSDDAGHFNLQFPSGLTTPYKKNNLVHARYFPAGTNDKAVIVSPQWNAQPDSHIALCHALNRFGISALRLSLPYHDNRMLDGFTRADFMVSPNIGRTIQSVRQSVLDIRRAADWLFASGVKRVGVMGTSIGSCASWLAFIHDHRLEGGVFNLVSSWFGDVVWRALTTSHLRRELESQLTAEELREAWKTISPSAHTHRLPEMRRPALCISASYDLTFLPDLTKLFLDDCQRHGVPAQQKFLQCGHYTIGQTPFKYVDAFHIVNFFRRLWR